ncbi:MAG: uroporphyrinogen decarboxylase, partial [Proteobacteria bacterium]|nr:uroporphyrinogen decarboxylase [Pseudomonadota bacterium]
MQKSFTQPKSLVRALRGEVQARPNFWFMRQAGRYLPEYRALRAKAKDFIALCLSPELAAEITLQPVHRFAMDAAILFSDILMVPYGLGQKVEFREGEGPILAPVASAADIAALEAKLDGLTKRVAPVFETVRLVAARLPVDTALIGFCGAPWTVATYMVEGGTSRDFTRVRRLAYAEPEAFQRLIDVLIEASLAYLAAQIKAGAEAVQIFDSWAGILPEAEFQRWCIEPMRELVQRLRDQHASVPIIAFPKGAGLYYPEYVARTGVEAIGIDSTVPLEWAAAVLQPEVTVQGNLDPLLLV